MPNLLCPCSHPGGILCLFSIWEGEEKDPNPSRYRAGLGQLHTDVDELVLQRFLLVQQLLWVGGLAPKHLQLLVRPHQGTLQALLWGHTETRGQ